MLKYLYGLLFFVAFFVSNAGAQSRDSLMKVYNAKTIYKFGNYYIKDNRRMTFQQLGTEFYTPATLEMYRRSKSRATIGSIFNIASLGLIVVAVVTHTNVGGSIAFAAGTGVLGLGAFYFQSQSSKYLERALWERNKMVLGNSVPQ
jgi:hypothetical protein